MESVAAASLPALGAAEWQAPIDSVGTDRFDAQLMRCLEAWAGVEHCATFILAPGVTRLLSSSSSVHSAGELLAAARSAALVASNRPRVDEGGAEGSALVLRIEPPVPCEGVFVCGDREGVTYGLALTRTLHRGRFSDAELDCLRAVAGTWLSLISKHERLMAAKRRSEMGSALLGSVKDIEDTLRTIIPALTQREAQVCARLLRGMSIPGIALDLAVREISVATYRKRAYRRLGIGTQFELVQLFIASCVSAVAS